MNEEQKVKKRGWVKNAAIIFLSVMLLLTFFSNTIMNRSLPEVATQYAESGTINAKIRGTGTVTANESYQVTLEETREIQAVMVKLGDAVEVGDVLFVLADAESEEMTSAEEALDSLTLQYQKALLSASGADYSKQNRTIQSLRSQLSAAIKTRDSLRVSANELTNAKNAAADAQTEVNRLKRQLASLNAGEATGSLSDKIAELDAAEGALAALQASTVYTVDYQALVAAAQALCGGSQSSAVYGPYMAELASQYASADTDSDEYKMHLAYKTVTEAEGRVTTLRQEVMALEQADEYNDVSERLEQANLDLADASAELAELEKKQENYDAAAAKVTEVENSLQDALADLSATQSADKKTQQEANLDLANMRKQIARAQEKLNKYLDNAVGMEITANVSGVVSALNVSAGNTTGSGQTLAAIDVVDRGYCVKIPVTTAQSRKVHIGDTAEVTNYWEGGIQAVLQSVIPDPEKPGEGKLLVFKLEGELDPGVNLGISIGQPSANYDTIVPNSAIRTDSNGDFVLAVTVRSSPLGNRYTAARVDVQVQASDDVNTAVSGLSSGEYVITTSSRPLEPGMLVRLPDNA